MFFKITYTKTDLGNPGGASKHNPMIMAMTSKVASSASDVCRMMSPLDLGTTNRFSGIVLKFARGQSSSE